eukprot:COSAG02_NODE_59694_length_273_cov_0.925287_1_plen_69_part_01
MRIVSLELTVWNRSLSSIEGIEKIDTQLTTADQAFTELQGDWDLIGSVFDEIGPMLDGAIQQVVGVASS